MRLTAFLVAFAFVAAPMAVMPLAAHADGIERPRPRTAPRRAPPPTAELRGGPEVRVIESNVVVLPESFFAGSAGGVGVDFGAGGAYSSSTVIVRGGSASASAFAFASARASARGGGGFRGRGGGCACH